MEKFDYRKWIANNKFTLGDVKSKNFENSVITLNEASIKDVDIKVGSKFELPNGEIIEIKKKFKENNDEDWVEYNRSGGSGQQGKNEGSVKQLRLFLNNWKANKKK